MTVRRRLLVGIGFFYLSAALLLVGPYPFGGRWDWVWEIIFVISSLSCFAAAARPQVRFLRYASAFLVTLSAASRFVGFTVQFGLLLPGVTWAYVTVLQLLAWPYILPLTAAATEVLRQHDPDAA